MGLVDSLWHTYTVEIYETVAHFQRIRITEQMSRCEIVFLLMKIFKMLENNYCKKGMKIKIAYLCISQILKKGLQNRAVETLYWFLNIKFLLFFFTTPYKN